MAGPDQVPGNPRIDVEFLGLQDVYMDESGGWIVHTESELRVKVRSSGEVLLATATQGPGSDVFYVDLGGENTGVEVSAGTVVVDGQDGSREIVNAGQDVVVDGTGHVSRQIPHSSPLPGILYLLLLS